MLEQDMALLKLYTRSPQYLIQELFHLQAFYCYRSLLMLSMIVFVLLLQSSQLYYSLHLAFQQIEAISILSPTSGGRGWTARG